MSVFGAGVKADSPGRDYAFPALLGSRRWGQLWRLWLNCLFRQVWGVGPCPVNFG